MSKIILTGGLGYIGWPLVQLLKKDHNIMVIDNNMRAEWVNESKSTSAIPIKTLGKRRELMKEWGVRFEKINLVDYPDLHTAIVRNDFQDFQAVIHLAAQPSMPYSMKNREYTIKNNGYSTRNIVEMIKEFNKDAHLLFASTMGEWGTPNIKIEDGYLNIPDNIDLAFNNPHKWYMGAQFKPVKVNFPRDPSSYYHLSKVYDSQYILLSNKLWGLNATIFNQGVVYGTKTSWQESPTRWDFDFYFGTALNRFIAQTVIGEPMTIYGSGNQSRGFLHLEDACQGFNWALHNKPKGVVFHNHITQKFKIGELAELIGKNARKLGLDPTIYQVPNPRKEADYHQYDVKEWNWPRAEWSINNDIKEDLQTLIKYKDRIIECKESMNKND